MRTRILYIAAASLLLITACKKSATTTPVTPGDATLKDAVLTQNLMFPWEILWGPDSKLWITERGGKISRINPADGSITPVVTISEVVSQGEGGLLGMVLHPDFAITPEVFVAYNYSKGGTYTKKIVKFTYNGTTLVNPVVLLDNIPASNVHNGTRLAISPDKKLFITSGDASVSSRAQNQTVLQAKFNGSTWMAVSRLITQFPAAPFGVTGTATHRDLYLWATGYTVLNMVIRRMTRSTSFKGTATMVGQT